MGAYLWLDHHAGAGLAMDFSYAIVPFVAWFVTGVTKFLVNSFKAKKLAFKQVGYGGFPSNHSAIVSSITTLIALKEGFGHPAFGVAVAFSFIVLLDANSLRRQIGKHAEALNQLNFHDESKQVLRERIGHTLHEIVGGIAVGGLVGWLLSSFA